MFDFRVNHVGVFKAMDSNVIRQDFHSISLNVRGMRRLKTNGLELIDPGPFFLIAPAGMEVAFDYGADRENWVTILSTDAIRVSALKGFVEIRWAEQWISIPCLVPIDPVELPAWQRECQRMREMMSAPLPRNQMRLHLGVYEILRYCMDQSRASEGKTEPAARLRTLLDEHRLPGDTLATLSRQMGYSTAHARALFRQTYGVSPGAYRLQRRLAEAMELVANSNLTIKEIAFRLQFRQLSHFSRAFKKAFGLSPRQAVAKFRRVPIDPA